MDISGQMPCLFLSLYSVTTNISEMETCFTNQLWTNPEKKKRKQKLTVSLPLCVNMRHFNISYNNFVLKKKKKTSPSLKNVKRGYLFDQNPLQNRLNERVQSVHLLSTAVASLVVWADMHQMSTMCRTPWNSINWRKKKWKHLFLSLFSTRWESFRRTSNYRMSKRKSQSSCSEGLQTIVNRP